MVSVVPATCSKSDIFSYLSHDIGFNFSPAYVRSYVITEKLTDIILNTFECVPENVYYESLTLRTHSLVLDYLRKKPPEKQYNFTVNKTNTVVSDPIRWCILLATVMPPLTYFVRKRTTNHYVLTARRQLTPDSFGNSLLNFSFMVTNEGKLQSLYIAAGEIFNSLEEICERCSIPNARPLTKKEKTSIEKQIGKNEFLKLPMYDSNCHDSRILSPIIQSLHKAMSPEECKKKVMEVPGSNFSMPSIIPCSYPNFTLNISKLCPVNKETLLLKRMVTVHNNKVYSLKKIPFDRLANNQINPKVDSSELKLKAIEEWNKIKDTPFFKNEKNNNLFLFILENTNPVW